MAKKSSIPTLSSHTTRTLSGKLQKLSYFTNYASKTNDYLLLSGSDGNESDKSQHYNNPRLSNTYMQNNTADPRNHLTGTANGPIPIYPLNNRRFDESLAKEVKTFVPTFSGGKGDPVIGEVNLYIDVTTEIYDKAEISERKELFRLFKTKLHGDAYERAALHGADTFEKLKMILLRCYGTHFGTSINGLL